MALQKDVTLANGVICSYHRLQEAHWERTSDQQMLKVASWVNKDAYDAGLLPVTVSDIVLNSAFTSDLTEGVLTACYQVLLGQPQFSGATEV